ncbi:hypothetical protein SAMN05421736_13315 [Evansella caseinilytica]|uniref:Uncharacterized protein n=1 Tax=Evansella caseinilytica TaxID=1503961 RepID=A0A1H3V2J7_9BACI|nr:hypothetical protein SAMN05421736_13315 [Evansella caseinilytica]
MCVHKENVTTAKRSGRGRLEQRCVHQTYVNSTKQRSKELSHAQHPIHFEHPLVVTLLMTTMPQECDILTLIKNLVCLPSGGMLNKF